MVFTIECSDDSFSFFKDRTSLPYFIRKRMGQSSMLP